MAERILMNEYKVLSQEKWVEVQVRRLYPEAQEIY